MWARYDAATGAMIEAMMAEEPAPVTGEAVIAMPPSAVAGFAIWSAGLRDWVDVAAPSRLDALVDLLVTKGVISAGEAAALPG